MKLVLRWVYSAGFLVVTGHYKNGQTRGVEHTHLYDCVHTGYLLFRHIVLLRSCGRIY